MSNTILGGDFTIYYLDENRQKRIKWSGSATGTRTANELYSALQDLFDESIQMDDGVPMSAQTPTEYTIGIIDAGDLDPWYISYDAMEHITGGAIKTAGWTHTDGSAVGIVTVPVTSNNITTAKIGLDISGATTGNGTLLDVIEAGTTDYLVIRNDTNGASDNFTTDTQVITCDALTATQSGATANTGEQIWANLYSIGTIEADTHIYVYQGAVADASRARIKSITDSTQDWWFDGHIDRCYFIKDYTTASFSTIDGGYLSVFVRKYSNLYDNFEVATSTTSGGRNPIPLATSPDLDNTTGYKSITFTASTGNWSVGDEMSGDTSGARSIITQIVNPGATQTVHYYLIDDPQTDFNTAIENLSNEDDTGTGTKNASAPADQGPALSTWYTNNAAPSAVYASDPEDIDNDGTEEGYGIKLNCNDNPLTEVYEWIKYTFRRGNTGTSDSDGIEAEQYVGPTVVLEYTGTITGTMTEGNDVTQETSGATGIIVSLDTTNKEIMLRDTRGTFATHATTHTLTDNDASGTVEIDGSATAFAAKKASPLGTFAGGILFGARGVVLSNWVSADENSFKLTDTTGNARERPQAYTITISNLVGTDETTITDDRLAVFRLTGSGGSIDKTEMSAASGAAEGNTIVVDSAIASDVPGKTTGGVLRIRDASDNNKEYRIRYSSWTGSTFTYANMDSFITTATTNTTQITYATGGFNTSCKRGDLVWNSTRSLHSYIASVDSDTQLTISPAIASQVTGDSVEINCNPVLINTADDVFVPLIDQYATSSSATVSIIVSSTIYYRVIVRNVAATTKIVPFATDDSILDSNRAVATIRTEDTIYS